MLPTVFWLLLLQGLVLTAFASVVFEDCGSAYALQAVNIEGCGMRLPCYVTLGEQVPVSVEFFADFTSSKLNQDVVININLVNLSTDVNPDPCEIVDCPVPTNSKTSFTSVMSVPSRMALNQRGHLHWRVYNERGRLVLCYSVLVQTQSTIQKILRRGLSEAASDVDVDAVNQIADSIDPDQTNINITNNYLQELMNQYFLKQAEMKSIVVKGGKKTKLKMLE